TQLLSYFEETDILLARFFPFFIADLIYKFVQHNEKFKRYIFFLLLITIKPFWKRNKSKSQTWLLAMIISFLTLQVSVHLEFVREGGSERSAVGTKVELIGW